jgi:hypothetical protein
MFSKTSMGKAALLGAIAGALGLGLVASSAVAQCRAWLRTLCLR